MSSTRHQQQQKVVRREYKSGEQRERTFQNLQEYWQRQQPAMYEEAKPEPYLYYVPTPTNNGELDRSEEQIYESIYDNRWRLMNQVSF